MAMAMRAGVVWEKGEPVRLPRGYATARASGSRPKLCSGALIDLAASMEPQKQAKQGSHGAGCTGRQARTGAAGEVRVVVEGSCPFMQVAGSGQFLREDSGSSAGSWAGPFEPMCLNSDLREANEQVRQQEESLEAEAQAAPEPVDGGQEARVQAGARKSEDERLLDELKALRLQVLGLGAREEVTN